MHYGIHFGATFGCEEVNAIMKVKPFGLMPSIAIIVLSVGLVNHVLIVPFLLGAAKRDAWMSVFLAFIVIVPWTAIPLFGLLKKLNHQRFDKWLMDRVHPVIGWIIMCYFLIILFLIASETLIVTSSWTGTTYLPNTPTYVIAFVFLCLCVYASCKGLRTIAYMSCLLVPIVVLLGDFVMSTNMPHKDYRYLLPMLEHGFSPVIKASINCLTAFSELFMLLLIQHHLKKSFKRWHIMVLIAFLGLLAVGPLTGSIAEFGPEEAEKMRYPAFAQWRLVSIGRYFEHVDFFAIFQWLSGALIRLSVAIYLIMEYNPLSRSKYKWIAVVIMTIALGAMASYWTNNMIGYRIVISAGFQYFGVSTMSLIVIIFAISFLKKRRERA